MALEEMPVKAHSFIAASLVAIPWLASAQSVVPVDLRSWAELGPPANGNWTVNADGSSVTQSINGDPTFFVGTESFIDTVLRGSIRVATSGDDDYMGFVMGYQSPNGTGNDMNYVLLDWKQNTQNFGGVTAQEGFSLNRVNGTITDYLPGFWGHADSASFDVLATNFSTTNGWQDNTTYDFAITYQSNRVSVSLSGGVFTTPTTVLDVAGEFGAGRFGFYNYSQANVVYNGFTLQAAPPTDGPPPVPAIPEPSTYALMFAGLAAVAMAARRRRR
jgi:hypothetical protein